MNASRLSGTRVVGCLVVVLAGAATVPVDDWLARMWPGAAWAIAVCAVVLVAGVGAGLLRTWWALLVIPAVYFAGYEIGALVEAGVRGSLYTVSYAFEYLLLGAGVFLLTLLLPLLLGAAVGTAITAWSAHAHG